MFKFKSSLSKLVSSKKSSPENFPLALFSTLPSEIKQLIFIYSIILTANHRSIALLEKEFPGVLEKEFWKQRFYYLFPRIQILKSPLQIIDEHIINGKNPLWNDLRPYSLTDFKKDFPGFFNEYYGTSKFDLFFPQFKNQKIINDSAHSPKNAFEDAIFWKKFIRVMGQGFISDEVDIKNNDLVKKLNRAVFRNNLGTVVTILSTKGFNYFELTLLHVYAPSHVISNHQDVIFPKVSSASLANSLRRKAILNLFYLNALKNYPSSQIWWACAFNQPEVLAKNPKGIKKWKPNLKSESPLIWIASQQGHLNIVNLLLEQGVDFNQINVDDNKTTALDVACQQGHFEIVQALINAGADISQANNRQETPLYIAIINHHQPIIQALIKAGVDINQPCELKNGYTPLITASAKGYTTIVKMLIDLGADVNLNNEITPLSIACEKGHMEVMRALLGAGANVNLIQNGNTPLHLASRGSHLLIVKALIKAGADVNQVDISNDNNSPSLQEIKLLMDARKKLATFDESSLLNQFEEYAINTNSQMKGSSTNPGFFHNLSPTDPAKIAARIFAQNAEAPLSLEAFLSQLKDMAKQEQVDLRSDRLSDLNTLINLSESFLGKKFEELAVVEDQPLVMQLN